MAEAFSDEEKQYLRDEERDRWFFGKEEDRAFLKWDDDTPDELLAALIADRKRIEELETEKGIATLIAYEAAVADYKKLIADQTAEIERLRGALGRIVEYELAQDYFSCDAILDKIIIIARQALDAGKEKK